MYLGTLISYAYVDAVPLSPQPSDRRIVIRMNGLISTHRLLKLFTGPNQRADVPPESPFMMYGHNSVPVLYLSPAGNAGTYSQLRPRYRSSLLQHALCVRRAYACDRDRYIKFHTVSNGGFAHYRFMCCIVSSVLFPPLNASFAVFFQRGLGGT